MDPSRVVAIALLLAGFGGAGYLIWRYRQFLVDSWRELRYNVTWPTPKEVGGTTAVVLVMVVAMAVFLFAVDFALSRAVLEFFSELGGRE